MEKSGNSLVQPLHAPARDYGSTAERNEWAAYKGHIRGLLRGLLIGAVLGAVIGLGVAPLAALAAGTGLGLATIGTVCAGFAGMGALSASHVFGRIGTWAGSKASSFSERELEHRYESVRQDGSPEAPIPGHGHEYPVSGDSKKPIFWRVSLSAALLAGGAGLLLGIGAAPLLAAGHLLPPFIAALGLANLPIAAAAVPAAAGAMYGFSYGINRSYFRKLFNHTDAVLDGKPSGPDQSDLIKSQEKALAQNEGKTRPVITSTQRELIQHHLLDEYYDKAFWGGLRGNIRGIGHWMTAGLLTGLAFAAVTVGILAVAGVAASALLAIGVAITALGPAVGLHYSEAGMASGVDTAAEAHYEKRRQLLIEGKDPHHAIQEEKEQGGKGIFNWRVAIPTTLIGIGLGAAAAPVFSHGILDLLGPIVGSAHPTVAATAGTFGLIGTATGLNPNTFKGLGKVADGIFNGAYYPGHEKEYQEEIVQKRVPLMSPDSYFKRLGEGCMVAGEIKAAELAEAPRAPEPALRDERPGKSAVERYAPGRNNPQPFADRARATPLHDRVATV